MRVGLVISVVAMLLFHGPAKAGYEDREEVQTFVDEMVAEHDFERERLLGLFSQVEHKQGILDSISRPAEKTLKWFEYRRIFIKEDRIEQGVEFWQANENILARAQEQFDVPPEYIVGILGVETFYGRIKGTHRVMDALSTLAFDYPPRSSFFRRELKELLLLAREEEADPLALTGSYAGAMGFGQFIPSSFRAYAVDFDGDGRRDIWTNVEDAIGSVANYFARHRWIGGGGVAQMVGVPPAKGVDLTVAAHDAGSRAALYRMDLEQGEEYWVGLNNFYVITRYNRSPMYALAVHQLGQEIKTRKEPALASGQ
jgi:membrane-bound lytic murein transglycosylase B